MFFSHVAVCCSLQTRASSANASSRGQSWRFSTCASLKKKKPFWSARGRTHTSVSCSVHLALRMSTRAECARLAGRRGDHALFCWRLLFLQLNYSSSHENYPSMSACPVCLNPLYRAPFHVLLPTLSPRPSHFPATLATHIFLYPTWMYSSYLSLTSPLITLPPSPPPRYFFYHSLFLIFIRLSPVCLSLGLPLILFLLMTISHFPSVCPDSPLLL